MTISHGASLSPDHSPRSWTGRPRSCRASDHHHGQTTADTTGASRGERHGCLHTPRRAVHRRSELITTWGLVLEATAFTGRRLTEGLERAGVSAPFFDVLVRLAREPSQRLPMTRLANEVSLTSGGFTKLADRMEEEGLLHRQHSAQDRRIIYAVLTDAGRAAAERIFPSHVEDLRRHVEGVLGPEGTAELASLCRKLRDANASG